MYESHHQSDHAIPKNRLTEIDYQLMTDVTAYAKCNSNMVEYNHSEYLALMQAQSNHLNSSVTENPYYQEEFDFGSGSNNSSNESLYLRNMDHQSSMAVHLTTSNGSSLNLPFSNSDSPQFSSEQIVSSAPTALSSSSSNQQYIQCSTNPYIAYQQNFTNTTDPSMYSSLEGSVSTYYGAENNNISHSADNHCDQFYGGTLDEQQQFFFMQQQQQQQQKIWSQEQQQQQQQHQVIAYSYNQHSHTSPSTYYSTAYPTDNDTRSQIYVRKACVSCKQSHVACDVQRPCSRCVRLNKTETCVDAQRKKRGRPCGSGKKKKEEESEFIRHQQQYF